MPKSATSRVLWSWDVDVSSHMGQVRRTSGGRSHVTYSGYVHWVWAGSEELWNMQMEIPAGNGRARNSGSIPDEEGD